MDSRIIQLIDEIEYYIDRCKYQLMSNTKIIVDKEHIDELLRELRAKTPDEIKRYQKIISNKEAILEDARQKAEVLINETTQLSNQKINEHEIMQQAYAQANEVVTLASHQAQEILDAATLQANEMREAAIKYTDDLLAYIEELLAHALGTTDFKYNDLMSQLNEYYLVVRSNRDELRPQEQYISDIPVDNAELSAESE